MGPNSPQLEQQQHSEAFAARGPALVHRQKVEQPEANGEVLLCSQSEQQRSSSSVRCVDLPIGKNNRSNNESNNFCAENKDHNLGKPRNNGNCTDECSVDSSNDSDKSNTDTENSGRGSCRRSHSCLSRSSGWRSWCSSTCSSKTGKAFADTNSSLSEPSPAADSIEGWGLDAAATGAADKRVVYSSQEELCCSKTDKKEESRALSRENLGPLHAEQVYSHTSAQCGTAVEKPKPTCVRFCTKNILRGSSSIDNDYSSPLTQEFSSISKETAGWGKTEQPPTAQKEARKAEMTVQAAPGSLSGDSSDLFSVCSAKNSSSRKILIIITGGTICMDYGGEMSSMRPQPFAERLRAMQELEGEDLPAFDILEWENLVDSSEMSIPHWRRLALDVQQNYYAYDGFVVLHGTDTMAYTASALSFMLENLAKPVVFTGSMLPMMHVSTDAKRNLVASMRLAGFSPLRETAVVFGAHVLRGCRAVKIDCSRMDAFMSPSYPPLGSVGVDVYLHKELLLHPEQPILQQHDDQTTQSQTHAVYSSLNSPPNAVADKNTTLLSKLNRQQPQPLQVFCDFRVEIVALALTPYLLVETLQLLLLGKPLVPPQQELSRNSHSEQLQYAQIKEKHKGQEPPPEFRNEKKRAPRGVVLLLYGTGTAPGSPALLETLAKAVEEGMEIVILTQCLKGNANLLAYENGVQLHNLGVINGQDLTLEACVAKLSYLMGKGYSGKKLKELMEKNLRGELTEIGSRVGGEEVTFKIR